VAIRNTLAGVNAADIMSQDVPTMPRDFSLEKLRARGAADGSALPHCDRQRRPGWTSDIHAAQGIPRDDWPNTSIQAAMRPMDKIKWASPSEPVLSVLERMQAEDINQMPVLEDGRVSG